MVVNRTFECPGSAFQQSDPAAFTSFLFHGKHGGGLIAGMGRECGDAGEEVNCETLRTDAHNQAMRLLVRGDQPVFICGDGNDFRWFWHVHTMADGGLKWQVGLAAPWMDSNLRVHLVFNPDHHHQVEQAVLAPASEPAHLPVIEAGTQLYRVTEAEELRFQHGVDRGRSAHSLLRRRSGVKRESRTAGSPRSKSIRS